MNHDPSKIKQVAETIKAHSIQYINLQFTDMIGMLKSVGMPSERYSNTECGSTAHP
jgi:glutamine synthetase